ncbi:LysR substrate-binding domain-containing protein [soil metagenome]
MNYAQLKAFHAVALHGGFSKAAGKMAMSQPAVSDHIRKLEDAYGADLFIRKRSGVILTGTARKLFAITERLFEAEDQATTLLNRGRALKEGTLVLGADAAAHVLPLMARFRERHPGIAVKLIAGNSAELLARLDAFEIDFAVIAERPAGAGYESWLLRSDPLVAFIARAHPLAKREDITFAEFVSQPVVLREEGSATRRLLLAEAASRGLSLPNPIEIESREAAREAVARGLGIGIVSAGELVPDPRLHTLAFTDWDVTMSEFLVCLKARTELNVIRAVIGLLRKPVSAEQA